MNIHSITLSQVQINQMDSKNMNRVTHKKILSCISVVESLAGSYRVKIGDSAPYMIENEGFFIAPPQKEQIITHYSDRNSGIFRSRWLFMNVTVNNIYPLESLYDFPIVCPNHYQKELHQLMDDIYAAGCEIDRYSKALAVVSLLAKIGSPKPKPLDEMIKVQQYLHTHYNTSVAVKELTQLISVSPAKLYREFKNTFGISPIAYLNRYRMGQACLLLEKTDRRIDDIANTVGFSDALYFSRLFKNEYGVSPKHYRDRTYFQNSSVK